MMKALPLYAKDTLVFWDIKTYPVPSACDASRVAPCIARFLKNSGYSGRVHIVAVGLLTDVPCDVLRAVSSTGIVLHHVSLGSARILSAMYHWIELNRPPKNMMLISSNPLFFAHIHANKHRDGYNIFELFPSNSCNQESRWKNFLLEDSASLKEGKCFETFWLCSVCKEGVWRQGFENFTTHLNTPEHAQEATYMEEKAGAVTVFWDIKILPVPPDCDPPHRVGPCIKRFLKNEGFSGRITIAVIGLLTDVPLGIMCALWSTTGIVLVNVISGSKGFVPYMYRCLSDSSPANLMFIRPGFPKNIIRDLQVWGHNVIQPFSDVRCIVEPRWTKFLLEDSGTLEEDKCSETGEPVSWVCCKDICGQGFENYTRHLSSKEHLERWNRRNEKDKEAVEAGDEESATMATTVFWDIKRFPVPPDCDPRLVGPCIKRFLKDKGYSGHITIIVIGPLTDVPVDVLRALSSATGIVLRNVARGSKGFISVVYLWAHDMMPCPANMMLIGFCPKGYSDFISNLPRLGFSIIQPFPYRNVESLWKNFLLEVSGTLEEDKSSETGEPVSWVCKCKVRYDICGQGQGFENLTMHLNSKEHLLEMLEGLGYWSNEKGEEAVEAGDEAPLQSATMMWDHMVGRKQRTKLPEAKLGRYEALNLGDQAVLFLANDVSVARYFDAVIGEGAEAKLAAYWIMNDIAAYLKNEENLPKMSLIPADIKLTPRELAELIAAIKDGTISRKIGKEILYELLAKGGTVQGMIHAQDLFQITDHAEIEKMIVQVISENPKQLEQYRSGKTTLQGYFVGQVMKMSQGKVNPGLLKEILLEKLKD